MSLQSGSKPFEIAQHEAALLHAFSVSPLEIWETFNLLVRE
jgi:hypothetical protein